jgi:chromosome segregation ATPase
MAGPTAKDQLAELLERLEKQAVELVALRAYKGEEQAKLDALTDSWKSAEEALEDAEARAANALVRLDDMKRSGGGNAAELVRLHKERADSLSSELDKVRRELDAHHRRPVADQIEEARQLIELVEPEEEEASPMTGLAERLDPVIQQGAMLLGMMVQERMKRNQKPPPPTEEGEA